MSERSPRCLVCGHQFGESGSSGGGKPPLVSAPLAARGQRELRLSIPIAIGVLAVFLALGGAATYFALQSATANPNQLVEQPLESPTSTLSPTPETPTVTVTPQATYTPLSYTVQSMDTCGGIAFAFNIQPQDIILANSLNASCALSIGQVLSIPQPTFTPTPAASPTLSEMEATLAACETRTHVVQQGETLSLIAVTFGVPMEAIMQWNNLVSDTAFLGQRLTIPLCERTFVGAATVTPTIAPPYPAPEPLLPANGAPFASSSSSVTLQWSSVGALRGNEYYQVTVTDITGGQNRQIVGHVKDTSFSVPSSFRPTSANPHIFSWQVVPVAQIGVDAEGQPVYIAGGPNSEMRFFSWSGGPGGAAPPATPSE
ncbi:MAG: LysM peptidoglycan-binding domain-containing protein [Anaerolineales bacterium]|nr:LysM peptidoglycan-binding domain-containing protein [Anaerolineales bacterium]